jgi:hypothetical protein
LKYEWFKDAHAQLAKKQADIKVFTLRYDREANRCDVNNDRRACDAAGQAFTELAGIKSSFNTLAAEYNANMAKINYRFTNIGDVPAGGDVLPREHAPYVGE